MRDLLIGIDLGTTGCKAVVSDPKLNVLGEAYIEYSLITHSSKEIEQDACEWWEMTKKVIRQVVILSGAEKKRFKGINNAHYCFPTCLGGTARFDDPAVVCHSPTIGCFLYLYRGNQEGPLIGQLGCDFGRIDPFRHGLYQ